MNCKNHKIRTKKGIKYGYCTLYRKEVPIFGCKCDDIDRKDTKTLCNRSRKLSKREKERYSILYRDLSKCAVCGSKRSDLHEVFEGSYRQASIKYGMVIPVCRLCHQKMHQSKTFAMYYKIQFEKEFLKTHTLDEWLDIFKIDYRFRQ